MAATTLEISGQASGWVTGMHDTSFAAQAGLRYIPTLFVGAGAFDAELAANGSATVGFRQSESVAIDLRLKPYRAWLRVSSARFEARAGLQKISFGSAYLLRPLQWFDRLDPRDPLSLTEGVYGLLGRYYFPNNINIWAWGLLGNLSPKGLEEYGTVAGTPELGGRVQLSVPRGELAATGHYRRVAVEGGTREWRVGLDGRWDVEAGIWFEAMMERYSHTEPPHLYEWRRLATAGVDYTFGLGNGLYALAEHMVSDYASLPTHLSSMMLSYPLGITDDLRGMIFFDWAGRRPYTYLSWQHTLDRWMFSAAAFLGEAGAQAGAPSSGKGAQLMVVFNH